MLVSSYVTTSGTQYNYYTIIPAPYACWWLDLLMLFRVPKVALIRACIYLFSLDYLILFNIYNIFTSIVLWSNCEVVMSSWSMHGTSCHCSLDHDEINKYLHEQREWRFAIGYSLCSCIVATHSATNPAWSTSFKEAQAVLANLKFTTFILNIDLLLVWLRKLGQLNRRKVVGLKLPMEKFLESPQLPLVFLTGGSVLPGALGAGTSKLR